MTQTSDTVQPQKFCSYFLKICYMVTKTNRKMQSFANCFFTQKVSYVLYSPSQHGNPFLYGPIQMPLRKMFPAVYATFRWSLEKHEFMVVLYIVKSLYI